MSDILKKREYQIKGDPRKDLNDQVFRLEGTIQEVLGIKKDVWMDPKLLRTPVGLAFVLTNKPSMENIYYGKVGVSGVLVYERFLKKIK